MEFQWKQDAINHAMQCDPEESCGIIGVKNNQEKCKQIAFNAQQIMEKSFTIENLLLYWYNIVKNFKGVAA